MKRTVCVCFDRGYQKLACNFLLCFFNVLIFKHKFFFVSDNDVGIRYLNFLFSTLGQ